jgi:hypothetical protein
MLCYRIKFEIVSSPWPPAIAEIIELYVEDQASSPSSVMTPPSSLSRVQVVSLSQSSCVSPLELTDGREEEGLGEEPNHTTVRKKKTGPL